MTVLVGALCSDGVVIGADSIATSAAGSHPLIRIKSDDKIRIVHDQIIIAGTGSVGLGQRFYEIMNRLSRGILSRSCVEFMKAISTEAIKDFQSTGIPLMASTGYGFGAMVAAPVSGKPELIEFSVSDMQPERKTSALHFVSMGSGQILADPFLAFVSRVLWGGNTPDVKTAMFGVYWALSHAIQYAPGGVGEPIRIAVLRQQDGAWRARLLEEEELQEQAQHISLIEERIRNYPAAIIAEAPATAPPTPPSFP